MKHALLCILLICAGCTPKVIGVKPDIYCIGGFQYIVFKGPFYISMTNRLNQFGQPRQCENL